MGKYNFDEIIERKGSSCIKYDALAAEKGRDDLMPFWVADMDFKTPDFIVDALRKRIEHPVFGYPSTPKDYFPTIASWVENLHGWKVDPENIRYIPGIVKGIGFVVETFCNPGDKVIIQTPVYHPFRIVPEQHDLQVVFNPLAPVFNADGSILTYEMDFEHLESILDEKVKVLILSNPHNPVGICWSKETLEKLAEITSKHGVIVISDEIHSEMALWGKKHLPYASVSETAANNSITFMAPSKTFNIAGIVSSYVIISNPEIREKFFKRIESNEVDYASIFSVVATMAAYKEGNEWRKEMLEYVQGNIAYMEEWFKTNLPQISVVRPDASFLVWLDCRKLGLSQPELVSLFEDKAKLALNDGSVFGPQGVGFMRFNVGCPRTLIQKGLESLKKAF